MIRKHKICSSGKKIIPNKRTKIPTWELAGTFKDFFSPPAPASKERKADTGVQEEQDSFMQGLLTPSPKYFLTDSHRVSNQSRNYSASGIDQQANWKKSIQLWS